MSQKSINVWNDSMLFRWRLFVYTEKRIPQKSYNQALYNGRVYRRGSPNPKDPLKKVLQRIVWISPPLENWVRGDLKEKILRCDKSLDIYL
jgi:hypothetical protein